VKQISALVIGFAVFAAAFAIAPARAEDLTAGKTPAQLFRSDCGACHHSPNGLVKERGNVSGLAAFLREHYTTKAESAAALAAYVSGLAPAGGGSARNGRERRRSEGDAPLTAAPAEHHRPAVEEPAGAAQPGVEFFEPPPADDPPHRRHSGSQPDAGKRRAAHDDGDAPRPPREVATAKSNAATRASQPQPASDPLARLRSYLSSGLNSESASAQAARTGAPKARKRRPDADETTTAPRENPEAPSAADAEPRPQPAAAASAPAETAPQGEPQ
jgi:hypothetical protein